MGNLAVTEEGTSFSAFPFIGDSLSGTGDLFASIVRRAEPGETPWRRRWNWPAS